MPPKRTKKRPPKPDLEVITIRAQDVLDRLMDALDSEHQRVALRREWRENPTPAERAYLALGLDQRSDSPEFILGGRRVSAEFAAGYKHGYETGSTSKHLAQPLSEPRMGESLLETAWGIIANAGGGNWDTQTPEWRGAAARWRDDYHASAGTKQLSSHESEEPKGIARDPHLKGRARLAKGRETMAAANCGSVGKGKLLKDDMGTSPVGPWGRFSRWAQALLGR